MRVFGNQEVKINAWKSRVTGRFVPGLSSLYWDRIIVRFDSCFKRLYLVQKFVLDLKASDGDMSLGNLDRQKNKMVMRPGISG